MTDEMIMLCYEYGKRVHAGENVGKLADKIVCEVGMKRSSAIMYLYAVSEMIDGIVFKRAISTKAIKRYFDMILTEYGREGLEKAIRATRYHIDYRRKCGHTVDSIEMLCDKYQMKI